MDEVGLGEAGLDVADMAVQLGDDVALWIGDAGGRRLVVQQRRARAHRLLGVEDGGQDFVGHSDEAAGGLRRRLALRHHRRDALADATDDGIEHERVVGIVGVEFVPRGREMMGRRIVMRQHGDDAWGREGGARVDRGDAGGRMRRAQDFHVQQAVDRDVHRIAGATGDDGGAGGRGEIAPARLAWRGFLDMPDAVDSIRDRAIAGATAKIAFERARQVAALRLIERCRGHHHAGGAEAALKALSVEESLLHRMQSGSVGVRQPLDRRDAAPFRAKRRHEAAMHGLAVEMNRAGAAIAGVAALFHAEPTEFAQEGAQALAGTRRRLVGHAVDEKAQRSPLSTSQRISSANSKVM